MKDYLKQNENSNRKDTVKGKQIIQDLIEILKASDWEESIEYLDSIPKSNLIAPLFTTLCSDISTVRWHGITVFGIVVKSLADTDYEKARDVMRRCIWSLNDESGGIGWGAPEVMGEIMASNGGLAREFHTILISYIHEEDDGMDNFLEFTPLRKGAFWGIARLAQIYPDLVSRRRSMLLSRMQKETEPEIIGLLCWTAGLIHMVEAVDFLREHQDDYTQISLFRDRKLLNINIDFLANEALELIEF